MSYVLYIGVTEGKKEKLKKKAKWALASLFHLHNTLILPEGEHKIWKHWL